MIRIQGRVPEFGLAWAIVPPEEIDTMKKLKFRGKVTLEKVGGALSEATKDTNMLVSWFALVTLSELGDRSDGLPRLLVNSAQNYLSWSKESGEGSSGIVGGFLEGAVAEETIRALSYFSKNRDALEALTEILHAHLLVGHQKVSSPRTQAIYALGAIGASAAKEHLEYLTFPPKTATP